MKRLEMHLNLTSLTKVAVLAFKGWVVALYPRSSFADDVPKWGVVRPTTTTGHLMMHFGLFGVLLARLAETKGRPLPFIPSFNGGSDPAGHVEEKDMPTEVWIRFAPPKGENRKFRVKHIWDFEPFDPAYLAGYNVRKFSVKPSYCLGRETIEAVALDGELTTDEVDFIAASNLYRNNPYHDGPECCNRPMINLTTQETATWGERQWKCAVCGREIVVESKKD